MSCLVTVDAIDLLFAVWAGKQGAAESPPASNAGPYVERVLKGVFLDPHLPWCAAEFHDAGVSAFGKLWPCPATGGCQALADFFAKKKKLFATPQRGDAWLKWEDSLNPPRFGHVGIVRSVPDPTHIIVQAGNTVRPGQPGDTREGWLNWTRTEAVGPKDRFGRWVDLLPATLILSGAAT